MEPYLIQAGCVRAVCRLLTLDQDLLKLGANERSITHKLAEYLSMEFPGYHVDCEYNRVGHEEDTKVLPYLLENTEPFEKDGDDPRRDVKARTVYPDIIIHRRATDVNLLVIEMKTTSGGGDYVKDQNKLRAFTSADSMKDDGHVYHYQLGLFIEVSTGGGLKNRSALVAKGVWFQGGKPINGELEQLCEVPCLLPSL